MKISNIFIIKKQRKRIDSITKPKPQLILTDKEEQMLYRLIRVNGKNLTKIVNAFNNNSNNKITLSDIKEIFKSKKHYWTPEEERILLEKHSIYGNKWSLIAKYLDGRDLRKIIKELFKDKNFQKKYLKSGMVPENKLTVNNVYKLLKQNDISYEGVNKQVVFKIITSPGISALNQNETSCKKDDDSNNFLDIPSPNSLLSLTNKRNKISQEELDDISYDATVSESDLSRNEENLSNFENDYKNDDNNIVKDSPGNFTNEINNFNDNKNDNIDKRYIIQNIEELNKLGYFSILNDENENNSHNCFSYLNI